CWDRDCSSDVCSSDRSGEIFDRPPVQGEESCRKQSSTGIPRPTNTVGPRNDKHCRHSVLCPYIRAGRCRPKGRRYMCFSARSERSEGRRVGGGGEVGA